MSDAIFFAPLRVPITDPRTGLMAREWYLFFQQIFLRVGGTSGQSNDDLLQGIPEGVGAAELLNLQIVADIAASSQPPAYPSAAAFDDLLGELRAVREQLAETNKRLDDIQQGTQL